MFVKAFWVLVVLVGNEQYAIFRALRVVAIGLFLIRCAHSLRKCFDLKDLDYQNAWRKPEYREKDKEKKTFEIIEKVHRAHYI